MAHQWPFLSQPSVFFFRSLVPRRSAQTDLNPRGMVHVFGELWTAEVEGEPVPAGVKIKVVRVDGLTLRVQRYLQDNSRRGE